VGGAIGRRTSRGRRWLAIVGAVAIGGLALAGLLAAPVATRDLVSLPQPAADYAAATDRLAALQAADGAQINPACRTQALLHGGKTARTVVLLHGYTNCPQQFLPLGRQLHERGSNVLIPRFPFHGYADRMTDAPARLTALHLALLTDEAIDIARGLGDEVTVVGLSIGGAMAAWGAHQRADVDRAVVIAPLFGMRAIPAVVKPAVVNATYALPNLFIWWDEATKAQAPGPPYAYPRFGTRGIGATLRLAEAVWEGARRGPPRARQLVMVTTPADEAVDPQAVGWMVDAWRAAGHPDVTTYVFPADLGLRHDVIDPNQPGQQTEIVYPALLALIEGRAP
jgi:carboxylesterase